ncbi:hypothetical protein PV328_001252 [Microctonus aethiopoides]|uniref:Uncharacterized protein n=1 Tax=Microctonus aethiopoides TaxID=144406 RepID=A0AA39KXA3_9HYME|nr:hypothetical protein PV328_001252 [Microctonus aethiopoides]
MLKHLGRIEKYVKLKKQSFAQESLIYSYKVFENKYIQSGRITRNKSLILSEITITSSMQNNRLQAIQIYNALDNQLKELSFNEITIKHKMKNYIKSAVK